MDELEYYHYRGNDAITSKEITSMFLFTDRSIYRPGQTLFYKGIAIIRNDKQRTARINEGFETWLYLLDANSQKVDSVKVTTNEYGSFTGMYLEVL